MNEATIVFTVIGVVCIVALVCYVVYLDNRVDRLDMELMFAREKRKEVEDKLYALKEYLGVEFKYSNEIAAFKKNTEQQQASS